MCNTEQFWFVTERTFGCVPLLRDHLSCKTTFLWQKGWSQMTCFTVLHFPRIIPGIFGVVVVLKLNIWTPYSIARII